MPHPPEPLLAHRLPPAPHFVGRDEEVSRLRHAWASGRRGVLALVGLGGAGKTAVASRFLDELLAGEVSPDPDGVFVWSFYEAADAGLFLEEGYRYFAGGRPAAAKGAGLLHLLGEALGRGGPHLLVLDGLERVQRPDGSDYGRVEDPLLRGLLLRLADGSAAATALITSRFPLTDLAGPGGGPPHPSHHYEHVEVGGLPGDAALDLLRRRGVVGDDEALAALVERYGSHALTLDHLGGLIGQFLGGDPARAPEAPALADPGADRQALRLARLLRSYEEHLPPEELALLCRLCLLRRGADEGQVRQLFLCNPPVQLQTARKLAEQITRLPAKADCSSETLRGLADAVRETIEAAVCEAPLAGPEETFRQEVLGAAAQTLELHRQTLGVEVPELVRFYSDALFDAADERHPLSAEERVRLLALWRRYEELCRHPFIKGQEPPAALQIAFAAAGWGLPSWKLPEDVTPADVRHRFVRVKAELYQLTYRHFLLWRVRELCRLSQRKWALAGPLAALDPAALPRLLDSLLRRHLLLRESGGAFTAHPAVRDHFARLAAEGEVGGWHDLLREQMISLARRPGRQLPEDAATLDLAEEAIYHALAGGRRDEAEWLYQNVLGGLRHLGWKLGEAARGLRVLRQFDPCPDRWALAWHLRALGELDAAYSHNALPAFRAVVRLLQGRLAHVAAEGDPPRAAVADFLMGRTTRLPPTALGCVVPRLQLLLYLGRYAVAWHPTDMEQLYGDLGWGGEQARCRLLLAELWLRQSDLAAARRYLDEAAAWVLHSGSAEHLVLYHLVWARLALAADEHEAAQRAADEGLRVARPCGLGLTLIELLCLEGTISLARSDPAAAEDFACAALERAVADDCRFAWGEAAALHLWGGALFARQRTEEAQATLAKALDLARRLGDPRAEGVGRLLA
ncbi:MAG TPA: hypothetical protein VFW33_05385, partial [Gemmataceae bacterium]|nr:hypothetical protein [Gemmataceae bacterium]